jgi:sec-independent protein translocase protein TatA
MPNWLGGWELLVILAVVLLIFGPSQLPKLAKMFGKATKSLKDGMEGKLEDEDDKSAKDSKTDASSKESKSESKESKSDDEDS